MLLFAQLFTEKKKQHEDGDNYVLRRVFVHPLIKYRVKYKICPVTYSIPLDGDARTKE
jgi:hypothetical protein